MTGTRSQDAPPVKGRVPGSREGSPAPQECGVELVAGGFQGGIAGRQSGAIDSDHVHVLLVVSK